MQKNNQLGIFIILSTVLIVGSAIIYAPSNQITGYQSFDFAGDRIGVSDAVTGPDIDFNLQAGESETANFMLRRSAQQERSALIITGLSSENADSLTDRTPGISHNAGDIFGLVEIIEELSQRSRDIDIEYNSRVNAAQNTANNAQGRANLINCRIIGLQHLSRQQGSYTYTSGCQGECTPLLGGSQAIRSSLQSSRPSTNYCPEGLGFSFTALQPVPPQAGVVVTGGDAPLDQLVTIDICCQTPVLKQFGTAVDTGFDEATVV